MHLTNYSLNKKADGFVASDEADGGDDGSKRTVSSVFALLQQRGLIPSVDALWAQIHALVGRSLAAVQPALSSYRGDGSFFQVLGLDVLLDSKGHPWLLELNDHPSLRIDLAFDEPGQYSMNGLNSVPSVRHATRLLFAGSPHSDDRSGSHAPCPLSLAPNLRPIRCRCPLPGSQWTRRSRYRCWRTRCAW